MVISIDSKAAKKRLDDAEQVPIFELDGKTYSIPNVSRSEISLRYLEVSVEQSEDAANHYLLSTLFGEDAFNALLNVDGLAREDLDGVIDAVSKIVLPAANPKGRRG